MPGHKPLLPLALLYSGTVFAQDLSYNESGFQLTVATVATLLEKKDSVKLTRYISRLRGVYILNRIGIYDTYAHYKTLGFTDTRYPNAPFYEGILVRPPVYESLPVFDCEKWSKTGTYVDTTQTSHLLSEIATRMNEVVPGSVPDSSIKKFYELENNSRRVVIVHEDNELIFYLSYLNDRWFLTMIDKVTGDCSS
jgi:hypothetical protein